MSVPQDRTRRAARRGSAAFRPRFEALEDRTMLRATNVFQSYEGAILAPDDSLEFAYTIDPQSFAPAERPVLLGLHVKAVAEGTLDPAAIEIRRASGGDVAPEYIRSDQAGGRESVALVELAPDSYEIVVRGEHGTTGLFTLDIYLVGDADADQSVSRADAAAFARSFGATSGSANYRPEADMNLDGMVSLADVSFLQWNQGVMIRPAAIIEISPGNGEEMVHTTRETIVRFDEPINPATLTRSSFQLMVAGQTVPGQVVVSDTESFATFFPDNPLPASASVHVIIDGNQIIGRNGAYVDADGDGIAGGVATANFSTLPDVDPLPTQVNIDAAWLAGRGAAPYLLNQAGVKYVLQTDVSAPGTAFSFTADNVTLDLNGHKITYDQVGGGVPNSGFEVAGASPDQPASWNLSAAPGAVRESTFNRPMVGRWYLRMADTGQDQTIVSDWTELPANTAAIAHFVRSDAFWQYRVLIKLEVEHETLGVVAGLFSTSAYSVNFKTPSATGRYRMRMTLVHEDPPAWSPNSEYGLGDLVRPTTPNSAAYLLESKGAVTTGSSGPVEPEWNSSLGGNTDDGNLRWAAASVGTTDNPSVWLPSRAYALGAIVRPTVETGVNYELVRIRVSGASSSSQEPAWTPITANVNTADGDLSWKILPATDVHLDAVDIRAVGIHGVSMAFRDGGTIENGLIQQGAGGGFRSHGVNVNGTADVTLRDLTISTSGLESAGIQVNYTTNVLVSNNSITTTGTHKFDRNQLSAALSVFHTLNATVNNNVVHSGSGWGGIFVDGANGVVSDNTVFTQSVITNHYGIMAYGSDHTVRHNLIDADPGQGLRLDGQRNLAEDNDIIIRSVAPNWDIGRFSLDAIRVNDYWTGTAQENIVRNNRITIYGKNSAFYQPAAHVLNGIANVTNGTGNLYEGNSITAVKVDPEVQVSGIMPGSRDVLVVWRNNTITSDQFGILFGAYPTWSFNARFEGTRFVKGLNAGADYSVLAADPRTSTQYVRNTVFVNSTLEGGGTLRSFSSRWYPPATYRVSSSLSLSVRDAAGGSIGGALVAVKNRLGQTVFEGATSANGTLSPLELPAYDVLYQLASPTLSQMEFGPYLVTVMHDGLSTELSVPLGEAPKSLVVALV